MSTQKNVLPVVSTASNGASACNPKRQWRGLLPLTSPDPSERDEKVVLSVGLASVITFISSLTAVSLGWVGQDGYWALTALSLAAYGVCLTLGHVILGKG
jgi:hypothetical protein